MFSPTSSGSSSSSSGSKSSTTVGRNHSQSFGAQRQLVISDMFKGGFIEFLDQKQLCDVELLVGDQQYKAHRLVLSYHSEFFRAMFTGGWMEV